jgi:ribosome modulation factor
MSKVSKQFETVITQVIERSVQEGLRRGYVAGRNENKNLYQTTERRLRAYPELIRNIEKYDADIKDLKQEHRAGGTGRSKDIVMSAARGVRLSLEEKLAVRIAGIEERKRIDQAEITEVNYALQGIAGDEWYCLIQRKYFEGWTDAEIAEEKYCDERTIRRHKSRLIGKLMIRLYGAEGVGG